MTEIKVYGWWGNDDGPPENLKTKKQLAELKLKPVKPMGVIHCRKYSVYLYDPSNTDSVQPKRKPSQTQLDNLAKGRRKAAYEGWVRHGGWIEIDRAHAVQWAQEMLNRDDWVVLDTETTGLGNAEIVEIAIASPSEPLLDTLVKPSIEIPEDAIAIHGITNQMVQNSPTFPEIYPEIVRVLADKQVCIYNASFDTRILKYCCKLHGLPVLGLSNRSECVMEWYAQWFGEWSDYHGSYRWQPLCGGHRAYGDCLATFDVIKRMAADDPKIYYPEGFEPTN